jgi:hypothetical protein
LIATTLTGGIGVMAGAIVVLLVGAAAVGATVSWWRRRHDEPLFAGMDDLTPLELVDGFDDVDAAWAPAPADALAELERLGAEYPVDIRPSRSRRAAAGTGVLVALTVGALADHRSRARD